MGGSFFCRTLCKRAHGAFLARFPTNMPPGVKKSVCHKTSLIFTEGIESLAPFKEPVHSLPTTRFELTFVFLFGATSTFGAALRAREWTRFCRLVSFIQRDPREVSFCSECVRACACVRSWRGRAQGTSHGCRLADASTDDASRYGHQQERQRELCVSFVFSFLSFLRSVPLSLYFLP